MELHEKHYGVGLFDRLRQRGFYTYFTFVAVFVFFLLTFFDIVLSYIYEKGGPGLNVDLAWDIGINFAIGLVTAGIAWKYNGEPWINRPDTIKLDLDK